MPARFKSPALKRYQARILTASVLYALLLFGVVWLFRRQPPHGAIAYIAAVLPAAPLLGMFGALGLYLREETDEYQRYLVVRQILIATGLALAISTVWGFLESFVPVHHFEAYWTAVVWFAMFGVARCVRGVI